MVIGILQIELFIGDAFSLKDKRRVVRSLKDRLTRENGVAIAEVDAMDRHRTAILGIVAVSNEVPHMQRKLDKIVEKMRGDGRFVLEDHATEILTGH